MRFQVILVGLAALVCFAIGGVRLRSKLLSDQTYSRAERAGRWVMLTGDYSGIHSSSRWNGTVNLTEFGSVQASQAWDVSEDHRRVAVIDNYSYATSPGLKVYAARRSDALAEAAPAAGNTFYCPTFDDDGSLLFLETTGNVGSLRRLDVPKTDGASRTTRVRDVRTATAIRYDDCFERSGDGEWLAWYGTDAQIHIARKAGTGASAGYLADHKSFPGSEFSLSDDGASLSVRDGVDIKIIDVGSSSTRVLTSDATYSGLVDFSPDGTWLATITAGTFSGRGFVALRTGDATPVTLQGTRSAYYYQQPGQTVARWTTQP